MSFPWLVDVQALGLEVEIKVKTPENQERGVTPVRDLRLTLELQRSHFILP